MNREPRDPVILTDVTLREFGQNVPADYLHVFTPEIRAQVARRLVGAGFRRVEVFSCVSPRVAPAMNREAILAVAADLGRIEGVTIITPVPNRAGYDHFLSWGLGPDGYDHEMGIFFSAVEAHNRANLGRSIAETLREYEGVLKEATSRGIRVAGAVSAALGYRPPGEREVIRPAPAEVNAYIDRLLELGAVSVTLSDLQGVADEARTAAFFRELLSGRGGRDLGVLGYHPHHASGEQALANSLAVYEQGIRRFDASLGGTGGCVTGAPGNQPTEGLIRVFRDRGIETGIDAAEAADLARYARQHLYARIPLARHP